MKKITTLFICLLSFVSRENSAQTNAYCSMPFANDPTIFSLPTNCQASSSTYLNKYRLQQNYIPVANSALITLKITLHIITKDDGSGQWENTNSVVNGVPALMAMLGGPNGLINGNKERFVFPRVATYPSTPGFNSPYLSDSKLQYELTNIYFYPNTALYTSYSPYNILQYINTVAPQNLLEGLPIGINGSQGLGQASGINGAPAVFTNAGPGFGNDFLRSHLQHEIAHCLGLGHTYPDNINGGGADWTNFNAGCGSIDYLTDVFPPLMPFCPCTIVAPPAYTGPAGSPQNPPCWSCYEYIGNGYDFHSNNIMSGAAIDWTSPLQMGRRRRVMHLNPIRRFAKEIISDNVNTWDIATDETWDFDIQMYQDIIVKAPATLTVKCKIAMAIAGKIIVEKGARLIVDGGEITTWCKTGLWKGIEAEGTWGTDQIINNITGLDPGFGIVKVINAGTITNAHNGITNARSNNNGGIIWYNQGGIIQADNGNFINNIRDIQFLAYQNSLGSDLSKFTNCNFQITGTLLTGALPITRVSLWEVGGIQFLGCNFEYAGGNAYQPFGRGLGIYSINAKYAVDQLCANNTNPCNNVLTQSKFTGFDAGVYVANSNPLKYVSIKNTKFFDINDRAAYFQNSYYPGFSENYVKTPGSYAPPVGLYLNNCKYYNVKNNTIEQNLGGSGGTDVGIWIWNSYAGAHKVYRNTFSNLLAGIIPQYNNSGPVNYTDGLLMNCNDFSQQSNVYDIALTGVGTTVMQTQGVSYVPLMSPTNVVRNKYAAICSSENKWYIVGNSVKSYYHGTNGAVITRPDLPSSICKDAAVGVTPLNIPFDYANHCPPNEIVPCPDCPPPGLVQINQALDVAIIKKKAVTKSYSELIDGGNTQALLNAIASDMGEGDLKNLLLQYSPYLSDAVLVAYFSKTHFPLGHGVLIHDGNKPVSAAVWQIIVNRNLASGIMDQLTTQQNLNPVSPRTGLEQDLSLSSYNVQALCSEKIQYFLADSLPSSADSLISMFTANVGEMKDADIQLVYAYMNKGDFSKALDKVNHLGVDRADWANLLSKLISLESSPKKAYGLLDNSSGADIAFMSNYADTDGKDGQMAAQAIMKFLLDKDYFISRLLPVNNSTGARSAAIKNDPEETATISNQNISVYPNPTQNGINVIYNTETEGEILLELKDVLGRLIFSTNISPSNKNYVPLNNINTGIYLLKITQNGQPVYQSKIIKQD